MIEDKPKYVSFLQSTCSPLNEQFTKLCAEKIKEKRENIYTYIYIYKVYKRIAQKYFTKILQFSVKYPIRLVSDFILYIYKVFPKHFQYFLEILFIQE